MALSREVEVERVEVEAAGVFFVHREGDLEVLAVGVGPRTSATHSPGASTELHEYLVATVRRGDERCAGRSHYSGISSRCLSEDRRLLDVIRRERTS